MNFVFNRQQSRKFSSKSCKCPSCLVAQRGSWLCSTKLNLVHLYQISVLVHEKEEKRSRGQALFFCIFKKLKYIDVQYYISYIRCTI